MFVRRINPIKRILQISFQALSQFLMWTAIFLYFFILMVMFKNYIHLHEKPQKMLEFWWEGLVVPILQRWKKKKDEQEEINILEYDFMLPFFDVSSNGSEHHSDSLSEWTSASKLCKRIVYRIKFHSQTSIKVGKEKRFPTSTLKSNTGVRSQDLVLPITIIFDFVGDLQLSLKCRCLCQQFNSVNFPGSTVYAGIVRQSCGKLSSEDATALWFHLLLRHPVVIRSVSMPSSPSTMDHYYEGLLQLASENKTCLHNIQKDVDRVLAWVRTGGMFLPSGCGEDLFKECYQRATRVIAAFVASRSETEYCQGMSFLCIYAMHCLCLFDCIESEKSTGAGCRQQEWRCLHALQTMHDVYGLQNLYDKSGKGLENLLNGLEEQLSLVDSELWTHLSQLGMTAQLFAVGWLDSLFVYLSSMPLETVGVLWDTWLAEANFKIFIQISIALIIGARATLLQLNFEETLNYLQGSPFIEAVSDTHSLLKLCKDIPVQEQFYKL